MNLQHFEFIIRRSRAILTDPNARTAGVFVRYEPALDQHLAAFAQILVANLCPFAPGAAAKPGCSFDCLAFIVGVLVVVGDGEGRHRCAGGRITHFRVSSEMTYECGFVVLVGHGILLSWIGITCRSRAGVCPHRTGRTRYSGSWRSRTRPPSPGRGLRSEGR